VDMMTTMLAKTLQDHIRVPGGLQRVDQWMLPAGEMIFLKIDQEQGCLHILKV